MLNENAIGNCSDCNKICICKVIARCIKSRKIKSELLCSEIIKADRICAKTINASEQLCVSSINSPLICTEQLNATNICSNGLTRVADFQQCGKYRATAVFSANSVYTLGSNIDFDVATDDPNNNLVFGPTVYTVPLSGYYLVTVQLDQQNLQGTNTVAGIPIANLEILVNGVTFRENFTPYLSFHNEQKSTLSSLISLVMGDKVSSRYNVFVMTDLTGFSPYVGTVDLLGNGNEANGSMFKIHYLSSNCSQMPCEPCKPCTPGIGCDIPCNDSEKCIDKDCC